MAERQINPPHTYAEWVSVLEMLKNRSDDALVLDAMHRGTLEWQSGVAERFAKKLIDVINGRMNAATDKFQKEIARSKGSEREIVQALLSLRKEMRFLTGAIDLPVIPEKDRLHYVQLVRSHADEIQKSLEDSARSDRTGRLLSYIRNNRVNAL